MLCNMFTILFTCFCGSILVIAGSIIVLKYLDYTLQKDSNMLECILAMVIGIVMIVVGIGLIA